MANKLTHSIEDAVIYADGTNGTTGVFYGENGTPIETAYQVKANEDIEVIVRNISGRWVKVKLNEGLGVVGNIFGVKAGTDAADDSSTSTITAGQLSVWFE